MDAAREKTVSKFMSLVLRHEPAALGLAMDGAGWISLADLCSALQVKFGVSRDDVLGIVACDPKGRYVIDGDRIRAAQGHSRIVDLGLAPETPPDVLFHGTTAKAYEAIAHHGLIPGERTHVHLSPDGYTARTVATRRRGPYVILQVAAGDMHRAGHAFCLSENGVWLTESVPPQFLAIDIQF